MKNEVKKIPFTIASKRVKYLGVNLTKEMQYSENYKMLFKESKQDLNKRKDGLYSWMGRQYFKNGNTPK